MEPGLSIYLENALSFTSDAVKCLLAALISTVFIRRDTAKSELEKLKTGKFDKVIGRLLDEGKMTYLEFYKCRNLLSVAKLADEHLSPRIDESDADTESSGSDSEENSFNFDFDWFMRFYDAVGNISNEELQGLWAQVLAGEIKRPKTCSLRTLDIIRNLSAEEARAFHNVCQYVLECGTSACVLMFGFVDEKEGYEECRRYIDEKGLIYGETIIPLIEAGLFTREFDLAFYLTQDNELELHNDKMRCEIKSHSEEQVLFNEPAAFLTTSGMELFKLVRAVDGFEYDKGYALLCVEDMRKEYPNLLFDVEIY